MCLFAGPLFTDYTMAGFSTGVHPSKLILASSNCVEIAGQTYTKVGLSDFLAALAKNKSLMMQRSKNLRLFVSKGREKVHHLLQISKTQLKIGRLQ